jgi:hypothetical protein
MEEFKLTPEELNSPLWVKLEKEITRRLGLCRELNDRALDIDNTNRLRGMISAHKDYLLLNPANEDI